MLGRRLMPRTPRFTNPRTPRFTNMEGAEELARRRLPASVYEYLRGGTEARLTVKANHRVFEQLQFLPRAAGSSTVRDLTTEVLGCTLSLPVILAPAGFSGSRHRAGGGKQM
jgi:isopentenyl diphosphate isomerase/L-lactate dehydrogenase-like FMN-dependent dehydrogenase